MSIGNVLIIYIYNGIDKKKTLFQFLKTRKELKNSTYYCVHASPIARISIAFALGTVCLFLSRQMPVSSISRVRILVSFYRAFYLSLSAVVVSLSLVEYLLLSFRAYVYLSLSIARMYLFLLQYTVFFFSLFTYLYFPSFFRQKRCTTHLRILL